MSVCSGCVKSTAYNSNCAMCGSEALSISSELTGNSRQSQIELLIEEQGIELEAAKNPPYELYK